MKNIYEVVLWFGLWIIITVFLDIVGVGDWNPISYFGLFIIVYVPIYIMVRWVILTQWSDYVND